MTVTRPQIDQGSADSPAFLRVDEVAKLLRISRSAAYDLANAWLTTNGEAGIPAVRLGRTLRIPRVALERLLNPGKDGGYLR